ncbi:DUF3048 domain-containing protein [Nocardioides mangrovicus]|nr:DUF3048 domain-containing protein [Nocardioides mangrovicus]
MLRRSSRPARTASLAAIAALSLTLAGCGHGADSQSSSTKDGGSSSSPSATAEPAVWPLTGLPLKGSAPTHPPVVVKIDNTVASEPQEGLGKADLITEELVEGGLTRLAVFFDTRIPELVGPVRSMRASDIGIVKPVHGVVVTSGAAAVTIGRLKAAGVNFKSNDGGASGFYRDSSRHAPYNLMMHLRDLVKTLKPASSTKPYLQWSTDGAFAGTEPATSISARFGGGHTTQWSFQGGKYVNTNSNADPKGRFRPNTVIAVRVGIKSAGYLDPAGNFVPESITTGSGNAWIFHDGKALKGTWSKVGPSAIWRFKDASGKAVRIPAGHTWIEVMPTDDKGGNLSYQ